MVFLLMLNIGICINIVYEPFSTKNPYDLKGMFNLFKGREILHVVHSSNSILFNNTLNSLYGSYLLRYMYLKA